MVEGEALRYNTPIPTPEGWRIMGDIQVRRYIFCKKGNPLKITWVSPIAEECPCYEITFSNEEKIVADAEHKWLTHSFNERQYKKPGSVKTTKEIAKESPYL